MSAAEIQRRLNRAVATHQSGRLDEAMRDYRRILALWPGQSDALNLLGLALHQQGDARAAIVPLAQAVAANPDHPAYRYNLGNALAASGDFAGAEEALAAAAALAPAQPEVHFGRGTVLMELGRFDEAVESFGRATGLQPDFADAHYNAGLALAQLGRFAEAAQSFTRAPDHAAAQFSRGNALWNQSDAEGALAAYDRALALAPRHVGAMINRGRALMVLQRRDEAQAALEAALALDPNAAEAELNLGLLVRSQGDDAAAERRFRRALALKPGYAEAHNNLALALQNQGKGSAAEAACRDALAIEPGLPEALVNLGNILCEQGRAGEAVALYRQALAVAPQWPVARSNLLFALGYEATLTSEALYLEHREFEAVCAAGLAAPAIGFGGEDAERRLRIGFVSADLRGHSCGYFVEPLWAALDRERLEIHAYADVLKPDARTARMRALATHWRDTLSLDDAALAEQIREDRIDILVDLSGHTQGNRLLAFARRPAPVQATWLGYGTTTGLAAIDWRISDAAVTPEGGGERFSEQIWNLPRCFMCYGPPDDAPEVAPTPALASGHVTFGSFNNLAKLTPETIALWSRVLRAVAGSRLLLKARMLADVGVRERIAGLFTAQGVDPDRLTLAGHEGDTGSHLARYSEIDIALDPLPYNGGTTTCEALWMGVPVLSLVGERSVGRFGLSLIGAAGEPGLVAADAEAMLALAVRLAADPAALQAARQARRARVAGSALSDARGFAAAMAGAWRGMWRRHCGGGSAS